MSSENTDKKSLVSFTIVEGEKGRIRIVNPNVSGEGISIVLFASLIKHLAEIESWYNQATQK